MTDAPEHIWLQWIPDDIPNNDEITWCVDPIHEDDITYVRKDIADKQITELRNELAKWTDWYEKLLPEGDIE